MCLFPSLLFSFSLSITLQVKHPVKGGFCIVKRNRKFHPDAVIKMKNGGHTHDREHSKLQHIKIWEKFEQEKSRYSFRKMVKGHKNYVENCQKDSKSNFFL